MAVSSAEAGGLSNGLSAFGDLKYPKGFKQFDYVNPAAPKSGRLSMIGTAGLITFNSLNAFILKGDPAQGLGYLFDTLMTRAQDEPDAVYGLIAHSAQLADDGSSVTFYLRPQARFSDGSPVTAEDVVFSFNLIKAKGHPSLRLPLRDVVKATARDKYTVHYEFKGTLTRDLPLTVAVLPILSKAYYSANQFDKTTLKPPLGSGPYKIKEFRQGSFITYQRREDYWGWKLAVNRGRFNFAELRYEYFRDRTAEFEGLKAGVFDLREEFTSKVWATEYDIDQVRKGHLVRATLPDNRPAGAQGFFINTRLAKFADIRVRQALDLAFDFEWTNRNQFYGLYKRTHSFFENSPFKAQGPASAEERALLLPFKDQLPASVFAKPYAPPVSNGSGRDRRLLRKASHLLKQAGWQIKNGKRVNKAGETFEIEFLIFSPTFERIIAPYQQNLAKLGIVSSIRRVDPAQYQNRLKTFDFDIITQRYALRQTPGAELRNYWSSQFADLKGSLNLSGIKDPVVDALIEKVIGAKTRIELTHAARALDRVLRAGHYWVPQWYKAAHTLAYWNKFSKPAVKPKYGRGVIETWWYDKQKAAKLSRTK
jgi:microcin C transport system substrate-binding protein